MRILLLTFSGTGHTALYAKAIQERFQEKGHEAVSYLYRYDQPLTEDIESFDMLGIGYPIHAFNVPEAFNRFLKNLPKANKPYFIFKVSGEPFHF
ncbi:MAG: flavodoxin family protein, partial [Bacilli bacterium]|nr:flavodoxin family protein [Bacilli bacterium]